MVSVIRIAMVKVILYTIDNLMKTVLSTQTQEHTTALRKVESSPLCFPNFNLWPTGFLLRVVSAWGLHQRPLFVSCLSLEGQLVDVVFYIYYVYDIL